MEALTGEWVDIPFWDGYVANRDGEIARKTDGVILKVYPQGSGYSVVYISRGYGTVAMPVHRLICLTFHGIEGYEQGLFVDHIDTNRGNNRADNLRWVTPKENSNNPITKENRKRNGK